MKRTSRQSGHARLTAQVRNAVRIVALALALSIVAGCGKEEPLTTVEGKLQFNGQPLDNCLVTFLPESNADSAGRHSTGLTDAQGGFQLRFDDQQAGAAVGWHRVTVQDLSVSVGVLRRDNGTVDADLDETAPPPVLRPSRIPEVYMFLTRTPLRKEVQQGRQVINLEIK